MRGGYKTDGSSHKDGIQNEKNLKKHLLEGAAKELYPDLSDNFDVISRGGTKYKQDLEIVDGDEKILVSAKKKKLIEEGSFDWVNTTDLKGIAPLEAFAKTVSGVRALKRTYGGSKLVVLNASYEAITSLTSAHLTSILKKQVAQKNKSMKIMITETGETKDHVVRHWEYSFSDSPLYHSIENDTPEIVLGDGIDSARVVFKDKDNNLIDHGLRIRVVTNNGISALIGTSKANSNSSACVKFQQDNIPGLIEGLGDKIRMF